MAIQLRDVLTSARDRHPAFAKQRVPDAVLARYLTDYQRTLLSRAIHRNSSFLTQTASIVFDLSPDNAIGTAGAGTSGGSAGSVDSTGQTLSLSELPVGESIEIDTADAVVLVSSTVVASATSTTTTGTSVSWTTNAYAGDMVEIVAGLGVGQVRSIASNTSGTLTHDAWGITPNDTSLFRIVTTVMSSDGTATAVTQFPTTSTASSYLVRLNAQGVPYIDLTKPLVATFDVGIPLPVAKRVLGGSVRFISATRQAEPLTLVSYQERFKIMGAYTAYMQSGSLFLIGMQNDWDDVQSVDLRYVPEPPSLTSLDDYFLLGDAAMPTLTARAAYFAGVRVSGLPDMPQIDTQSLLAEATESEAAYLAEIGAANRGATRRIREVW